MTISQRIQEIGRGSGAPVLTALTLLLASPLAAQEDARWLPWHGCWSSLAENTDPTLLCIRPADGGVEMLTLREAEVLSTETFLADGRAQRVEGGGCEGSRVAEFSVDAERIYLEEEVVCEGVRQTTSGMLAMLSPTEWVDVRHVEVEDRESTWVQNYRIAGFDETEIAGFRDLNADRDLAVQTVRWRASAPVSTDDVIEASKRVAPEVVRAWVSEQFDPFDLDADALVRLSEAGVPPDVIDMMIAVSYPDRFALADGTDPEYAEGDRRYAQPYYGYGGFYDPYYYGFSRFGLGYGRFGFAYRPVIRIIDVRRTGFFGGNRGGRIVKGKGYTRGSSGGSTASGSPRSGSSGGRATGRTAKPRGGRGGGGGL